MIIGKFEIIITSADEYQRCFAEIWYENEVFAIISNDDFERIEILPRKQGDWDFHYSEILTIMDKAVSKVRMYKKPDEEDDTGETLIEHNRPQ